MKENRRLNLRFLIAAAVLFVSPRAYTAQSLEDQIAEAILAAPDSMRADATIVFYDRAGKRNLIREGTNSLICEPDAPQPGFRVQCYHESWQPVMDRMNVWFAEGNTLEEAMVLYEVARKAGELEDFVPGAIQYLLAGPERESAELSMSIRLPYATSDSVGIPDEERSKGPWLMWAGTPGAHIMIDSLRRGPKKYPGQ